MFDRARIRQDFNNAAESYDAHAELQNYVLQQLLSKTVISPDALLLDAGCGTGALARHLRRTDVIALDNAFRMCVKAHDCGNLPVNAAMEQLPFAENSFDAIVSSLALQWSPDWQGTIKEWLHCLKPGGRLVFSTFGHGTLHELAESFRTVDDHPHISRFINPADIQKLLGVTAETETVTEYYPDLATLARHLKALGARNKESAARAGLMTPNQFKRVEQHYAENYGSEKGLPVSWNIIYVTIQKP